MAAHKKISDKEKKCTTCKETKPVSEFYKDATRGDGYYTTCKKCHAQHVKNWQTHNAERFRDANMKWKREHKKQRAEESKRWAKTYPEKKRKTLAAWREKNPDYGKNWWKNNKDKRRNYAHIRRARTIDNGGNLTVEEWNAILDFYGHKCLCCGRGDVKLTIDHVIPVFHGGKHSADNVQPLCGPCNSRKKDKHIDYRKEHFHETPRD